MKLNNGSTEYRTSINEMSQKTSDPYNLLIKVNNQGVKDTENY